MSYDQRYMVKQYVAEVEGEWCSFRVFKTGDASSYLFCQLDPLGCDTGLHFPVKKRDMIDPLRKALANGYGFSLPAYKRLMELTAA